MLELKTYSTKELCEALNIKMTSFKSHKEKFLKDYEYEEIKTGRSKSYRIKSCKIDNTFIKLCEQIAVKKVKFPNAKTAELILFELLKNDWTIFSCDDIGWEIQGRLERHTVGKYIELFREYNILPKKLDKIKSLSFDTETGELFSKEIDPNKYTYYKVFAATEMREEVTKQEYLEMRKFIREKYDENLEEQLEHCHGNHEAIKDVMKFAGSEAYRLCVYEYSGVPMKAISKVPTEKSTTIIF